MALTTTQITELGTILTEIPSLITKAGKDGQQINAFYLDAKDALTAAGSSAADQDLIYSTLLLVVLTARNLSIKSFSLFNWDPFKPTRLTCDQVAMTLNFVRYKKLRNLS